MLPSRGGDCQQGRLKACPSSPEECAGVAIARCLRGSVFVEEPRLSTEGGTAQAAEPQSRGCPAVAAEASGVPGNTHKLQLQHPLHSCSCFLAPGWAGCTEPLSSGFALSGGCRHPSAVGTVPWTKGGQELHECFSQEDKFSLELSRRAPTPLSQSQGCFREHKG